MRRTIFAENKCYKVWSHGAGDLKIFRDSEDKVKFLFLLLYFQSPIPIFNTHWYTHSYLKKDQFRMGQERVKDIVRRRSVALVAFHIFDDHFEILVRNLETIAISIYMQRVLTAYSKYFNSKYSKYGHVFNGPFRSELVNNNLNDISARINLGNNHDCEPGMWSSWHDFVKSNRWGELLDTKYVMRHFKSGTDYKRFAMHILKIQK